jgi:hypothetical protein
MPFKRYFHHDSQDSDSDLQYDPNDPTHNTHDPCSTFSESIQFQIPQYMMFGPPTLAPGGGAEVLSPSMFGGPPDDFNSAWLTNNLLPSSTLFADE